LFPPYIHNFINKHHLCRVFFVFKKNKKINPLKNFTQKKQKGGGGGGGGQKYCFTLSLTSTLDRGAWSMPCHCHLNPNKETQYSLNRRLGGPQSQSGWVQKITPLPPGFNPQTIWPVASWLHAYIYINMKYYGTETHCPILLVSCKL